MSSEPVPVDAAATAGASGKPAAASGVTSAPSVSRADLIALVQKLQKKAAAAEAQVAALKKQQAETATQSNGTAAPAAAGGTDSASSAQEIARLQSELAAQSSSHAAALTALQSELQQRSDALSDARKQLTQAREENEAVKTKIATTVEEGRKLAAQVTLLQQQLRSASAAPSSPPALSPSTSVSGTAPVPSLSPAPSATSPAAAAPAGNGGGSFLLENANRELRAALKEAEGKHAVALQKSQHYQQLVSALEKQMSDQSSQAASAADAASKRLQELESKLATSDSKMLKSFQMINEEKKKTAVLEADIKAVQSKHAAAQAALAHAQELLRDSTAQLEQAQSDNNALRTANFKLTQRIESSADDEAGDLRELKKTLASRTEEITALRNEIDHTRSIHARTLQNLESELSLQNSEMEASIETQKREAERMAREAHELRTASENERRNAAKEKEELQARMDALQTERDAALASATTLESNLASLQRELDSLRSEHAASEASHAAAYSQLSTQSSEKYARLIQELKAYKIHTISASVALKNEMEALAEENRKLHEEIQHGKPGERKIFELATLQASRDESLREAQAEVAASQKAQVELRGRLEQLRVERDFLAGEVKRHAVSQQRSAVNLDYLKSVMVQFLGYEHAPSHRKALFPVIAQLLCFTREDHKAVETALKANPGSGIWSSLGLGAIAGFTAGGISTNTPGGKPISLPPSMPMGIDLSDAGHASPFVQSTPRTPADFGGSVSTAAPAAASVAAGSTVPAAGAGAGTAPSASSASPARQARPPAAH